MKTSRLVAALALVPLLVAAPAHAQKVVRILQTETEPQSLAVLRQIAAEFEKTRPGVSVQIEGLAWGDLEKRLTAELAAGAPPDAAHGQPITCVSFAARGLLRPLDDLVDSLGKDNLIDGFRKASPQGKVKVVGDDDKPYEFNISFNGFSAAHDYMVSQNRAKASSAPAAPAAAAAPAAQ